MKATWLILLLALGCRNESELIEQNGRLFLKNAEVEIDNLDETNWQVGRPKRRTSLSQNFVFTISLPYLSEEARATLYKKYSMDGWMIRLTHKYGPQEIVVGHVYAPMAGIKHHRQRDVEINQTKSIAIKISYAASYISERFRAFDCPAFGHNKKIEDLDLEGSNTPFDIEIKYPDSFFIKPEIAELTPSNFNAGNTLAGEYTFDIALYSLKNKAIGTSFIPLQQKIVIGIEKPKEVNGCAGVRPELQAPTPDNKKPFSTK